MQEIISTVKKNLCGSRYNFNTEVPAQGFISIFIFSKWLRCKQRVKYFGTDSVKAIN